MKKFLFLIFIISILAGIVGYLNAKITTFEECEKAGWLARGIRIYDGGGIVEKECFLWIGKSFVKQANVAQKLESKIDDQASVTVTVTPSLLSGESREWKFDITLSTHSVELDQDMTKVAILIDDSGKEYNPLKWEGASAGGHHREGVLIFNPIMPAPKSVELKISGIGGVNRSFKWQF